MKKIFVPAIFLLAVTLAAAQDFPPTIKVPVTFYDHLALDDDLASCASKGYVEFNMCMNGGLQLNCVENVLGPSGTPVFNSANPQNNGCPNCCWYNQYMDEWFIDNTTKGDERKLPPNMVIEDSLLFTHIGNGMYEFGKGGWFPLDGRGLVAAGAEQSLTAGHNYGFTMHMRLAFLYTGTDIDDNVFIFRGDDDVWVFMNGHLVLDIGGIHTPVQDQFTFAEARAIIEAAEGRPLIIGQDSIVIDFFYTERREVDANIRITTNIPFCGCSVKMPAPRANPPTCNFSSDTVVTLTHIFSAPIFYSLNGNDFSLYDGTPIRITEATILKAYSSQDGWGRSDTLSEVYTPIPSQSTLEANTAAIEALNPGESGELIITLNDRVYNPADSGYFLTVTTRPSGSGSVSPDTETVFILGSARPDIYLATLPVTRSGPPVPHDGTLQWPDFEDITVSYQDPFEKDSSMLQLQWEVKIGSRFPPENPSGLFQIHQDRFGGTIQIRFQEGLPQKSVFIYDIHGEILSQSSGIDGSFFSWTPRTGTAGILLCRIRIGKHDYLKAIVR